MALAPARKAALVKLHNVIDLDPTGTAFGYLAQPLVQQPLQSISLETFNMAAKAALALAQRSGPGLWGHVASLLHKPDRLLANNRTTYLLPTEK